ncbi:L-seryl-tRNA(Sec) selenium transferase [Skermanella sp. TT6]|uniref:L-seryl-tRNA(Sec) selenium transferase n=1 Tax=Skermanella cutis TaxID=2775420 RepID=A0ABX7B5T6_9PROT|nr:L-seryl-tRNA(Sec) selenium transferase [Skermanella sp. TT6]QQP89728.1 L-seryl-tRNA(Sec) selenium transferase [Skermanella sp. TT6]
MPVAPSPPLAAPAMLRALPQVQKLLESAEAAALLAEFPRALVTEAVRGALDALRRAVLDGAACFENFPADSFFDSVRSALEPLRHDRMRRVINGTGIVIHTNLGRAPLAEPAVTAIADVAAGYTNLEFDLESGARGSRYAAVTGLLCRLTGAEAALVVNNNAAAVLLALSVVAGGGEALVSRSELVEIGGSFRVPDVIRQGGARLVEVGTTNKTRTSDYEAAITPETRVILKVHQSNYRIVGFTSAPDLAELAELGRRRGLVVMEDLGSGTLLDLRDIGLPHEPTVGESIASGIDLVMFSADKLLGGPQAGIIVGRRDLIVQLKKHPLLRAVRIDKLSLAALEATLKLYLDPARVVAAVPVLAMLAAPLPLLEERAGRLAELLAGIDGLEVAGAEGKSYSGGGSLPETALPTRLVTLRAAGVGTAELARRLRLHRPAVVGRIAADRFVLDVRTLADADLPVIATAIREAIREAVRGVPAP